MALTRKALKAMGITDEQVDSIIEMHTETVDGLKADRDRYKADAEKLPGVQAELDKAASDLEAAKKDSWKVKYEAIKEEFDGYKADQTAKETHASKETAYRQLLKDCGISDKRIEAVLRVSKVDDIELEDGKIKGVEDLTKSLKEEWADFISTTKQQGPNPADPPANNGGKMTRDQIMGIKDRGERRKAIAANLDIWDNNNKGE